MIEMIIQNIKDFDLTGDKEPDEFCQECGRPLPNKDEWVCQCGATYTREYVKSNN